ncbi:S-adenosyl-L-methionine-dependent methyltransferase [Podospora fimiseda]|uniref:S-adenosyl-L-methionine-dependent methyltransferase n=1 Tax=Podospora fimiseda TaxID=252190 RepID=A0AAN7BYA6_9PEZI|nr:S-adenosyl-L-methionine-dependent methyltransferase [Podospora fimiseda]
MTSQRHSAGPLFDSIGQSYELAFKDLPSQRESLEWIISTTTPSSSILDIGSGTGNPVASTLSSAGHHVLGIDVSPAMISCAQSNVPSATFKCIDIRDFFPEEQYDVIAIFFSLIASVSQKEIKEIVTRTIKDLLKPGGIFVWEGLPIDVDQVELKWMGKDAVVSGLSKEESLRVVREAGLEIVKDEESKWLPEGAVEAGICKREEVWEEEHLVIWGRKPE